MDAQESRWRDMEAFRVKTVRQIAERERRIAEAPCGSG